MFNLIKDKQILEPKITMPRVAENTVKNPVFGQETAEYFAFDIDNK